jgi:hypothetical protein
MAFVPTTTFSEIRSSSRAICEAARFVRIDETRLKEFASSLTIPKRLDFDPLYHFFGDEEDTLAYIVTLDTINFGSGWFHDLRKLENMSGYYTVATRLKQHFEREGPLTAKQLIALSADACARLFGQEDHVPDLMVLFATALNELGTFLEENFAGSFVRLIESTNHSAAALVTTLRQMPHFNDVALWHGKTSPFLKRAQIMAWDLSLAFKNKNWGQFDDIGQLTIFADNLVPHVLRVEKVLTYDPALAARIDAGTLIEAGSEEEIELRAGAIHAVELMAKQRKTTPARLDYVLWNQGQAKHYKSLPRHRTKTFFY